MATTKVRGELVDLNEATSKVRGELVDLNEATSESGLKIPSGTELNRPTAAAGQIRNNTNATSDGSASCEEYYNGTSWQKLNNVALPVYYKAVLYTGNRGWIQTRFCLD